MVDGVIGEPVVDEAVPGKKDVELPLETGPTTEMLVLVDEKPPVETLKVGYGAEGGGKG